MTRRIDSVTVSPTPNDLGTQVLQVGTTMKGRVVNHFGTPLVSVGLEFVAAPDFQPLDFTNGDTDATGHFQVAVPFGSVELHFKPGPVPYYGGPDSAPTKQSWLVDGSIDVGDVMLPLGYTIVGTVVDAAHRKAVKDAEIDVINTVDGDVLYTPDHRTDKFGSFTVTVPAGTYDVHVIPSAKDNLSPAVIANQTLPPNLNLGTIALDAGIDLRGRVRNSDHSPCVGASVQLVDRATGLPVLINGNRTDGNGDYRFTAPLGNFDITFSAPFSVPSGAKTKRNVTLSNSTKIDVTVPPVAFFATRGVGTPGTGGLVPGIAATGGTPRLGNRGYAATCDNAVGGAFALVLISTDGSQPGGPLGGAGASTYGTAGGPNVELSIVQLNGAPGVAGVGAASFPLPIGDAHSLVGLNVRVNFEVIDAHALGGFAETASLIATIHE